MSLAPPSRQARRSRCSSTKYNTWPRETSPLAAEAKSYAERLFGYPDVGQLPDEAARDAIRAPVQREGVEIDEPALALIVEQTNGYAYFLQEWGRRLGTQRRLRRLRSRRLAQRPQKQSLNSTCARARRQDHSGFATPAGHYPI
jgi:hypothetical protein